jgi:hypothetical protein
MGFYFTIRESIRLNRYVAAGLYMVQSLWFSRFGRLRKQVRARRREEGLRGVAMCLRFRDEAPFLKDWLDYHFASGVEHCFVYNNFSADNYEEVLNPYREAGKVTLIEWPRVPASPAAEEDCVLRAVGQYKWVGFLDADEFVVIRGNVGIEAFLSAYADYPAVALHWYMFGSNGHKTRPCGPVFAEYIRRDRWPNRHVKCFVRPDRVTQNRNSHSWYFEGMRSAVTEKGRKVAGSISIPASAERAWINHYYCKSEEDYLEKAARKSTLDRVGMLFPTHSAERLNEAITKSNEVMDDCAARYYRARCDAMSGLLNDGARSLSRS